MYSKPKKHFRWIVTSLVLSFFILLSAAVPVLSWANPLNEKQQELRQIELPPSN